MKFYEVSLKTNFENEQLIYSILSSYNINNLVIDDPRDILEIESQEIPVSISEKQEKNKNKEYIIITFYLKESEKFLLEEIKIDLNKNKVNDIKVNKIEEKIWSDSWKTFFKLKKIDDNIIIKPEYEEYDSKEGEIVISIDPTLSFGTGHHETTELAMILLKKYISKDNIVIDVGTGTGILAILASKLNAKKVLAIDLDKKAVEIAKENITLNNCDNIKVINNNLLEMSEAKADLVVANMLPEILLKLNNNVKTHIKENGIYIISGVIASEVEEIKESLENFKIIEHIKKGEWHAFVCRKEGENA